MLNSTRMVYFNQLILALTVNPISQDFYCFNEDNHNVQNFYFNHWEKVTNQMDDASFVTVGVSAQI